MPPASKPRVVIIGGGAAGIFTAYLLEKNAPGRFELTILEKNDELGGNTRSRLEQYQGAQVNIDCGAQFFSETSEPTYCAMLKEEALFTEPGLLLERNAGVTVWSVTRGRRLFKVPSVLSELLGAVRADPATWLAFSTLTSAAIERFALGGWEETFGAWLDRVPFLLDAEKKAAFKTDIARPLMYQFGLVDPGFLDQLSARFVVYYYVGSLPWKGGPSPFTVYNASIGLDGILKRLLQKYGLAVRTSTAVTTIARQGEGWLVTAADGSTFEADEVVFGTNPAWTKDLLPAADPTYAPLKELLAGMPYVTVPVHLQRTEPSYMPGDPGDWSVSNVLVVDGAPGGAPSNYMLSVWFGPLRDQQIAADYFKSWGSPTLVPRGQARLVDQVHELMVGTPDFMQRRETLRGTYQGVDHLWHVGGYILDYDTQNSCLKSAANVASRLFAAHVRPPGTGEGLFLLQEGELPEAHFEGRPPLLDEVERVVREVAPTDPALRAWLASG